VSPTRDFQQESLSMLLRRIKTGPFPIWKRHSTVPVSQIAGQLVRQLPPVLVKSYGSSSWGLTKICQSGPKGCLHVDNIDDHFMEKKQLKPHLRPPAIHPRLASETLGIKQVPQREALPNLTAACCRSKTNCWRNKLCNIALGPPEMGYAINLLMGHWVMGVFNWLLLIVTVFDRDFEGQWSIN